MASRELNKGNLQYLIGEFLNAWGFANLQEEGDGQVLDKGVFTLDALAYPVTADDKEFQAEWTALEKSEKPRINVRYEQMRLLVKKAYDSHILSDRPVPFYDAEDEGDA